MRILRILKDEELPKKPAEEVKEITREIKELCIDMCVTMKVKNGIGLAAPQVGVNKRVIVINTAAYKIDSHLCTFMINPKIKKVYESQEIEERCLSFPGKCVKVKRNRIIEVEYTNTQGDVFSQEFIGLAAQVIQHEIDHLDGITMFDKKGWKLQ